MGRKLLPCPVCGGESFTESVTQGGLICTDCGSVSNQVEVAEDEDPQLAPKSFMRTIMNYVPVTEEMSRLKRERRQVMRIIDRRGPLTLLHGLGIILNHMVDSCVSHGLCHARSRESVRQTWFEFVSAVSKLTDDPRILKNSKKNKVNAGMARWGFPDAQEIAEVVTRDLPVEHAKRTRALIDMLRDRSMDHSGVRVQQDLPLLIYAHDWLCLLFEVDCFPFPDDLLLRYSADPSKLTWDSIRNRGKEETIKMESDLSELRRRGLIRGLFSGILNNENVRKGYMSKIGRKVIGASPGGVPDLDLRSLLAVLAIGIRNAEGGVEPIHILNWIARLQLPFFSAHKCLPQSVDRIEYYRVSRLNHGYKRSVFSASFVPSEDELQDLIKKMQSIGISAKPNHPVALAATCLDMMGLKPLNGVVEKIINLVLKTLLRGKGASVFAPGRTYKKMVSLGPFDPVPLFSDIHTCDLVLACIVVACKFFFPCLHPQAGSGTSRSFCPQDHELIVGESLETAVEYEIFAGRTFSGEVGDADWWQNCLSQDEKDQFLNFASQEMFNELRECLAQDVIEHLVSDKSGGGRAESAPVRRIRSGRVERYEICGEAMIDSESVLFSFVEDAQFVCSSSSRMDAIFRVISQLEHFLFLAYN